MMTFIEVREQLATIIYCCEYSKNSNIYKYRVPSSDIIFIIFRKNSRKKIISRRDH